MAFSHGVYRLNFNGSIQSPSKNPSNEHLHKRQNPTQTANQDFFFAPFNTGFFGVELLITSSFELELFDRFARLRAVTLLRQNSREKFDTGVSCSKMGVWCHSCELSKGFRNAVWKQGSLSFRSSLTLPPTLLAARGFTARRSNIALVAFPFVQHGFLSKRGTARSLQRTWSQIWAAIFCLSKNLQ